jgi:hypothetical protein
LVNLYCEVRIFDQMFIVVFMQLHRKLQKVEIVLHVNNITKYISDFSFYYYIHCTSTRKEFIFTMKNLDFICAISFWKLIQN